MTPPTGDPTDASRRMTRLAHWQNQYATRAPDAVGWYEADPSMSRRLVAEALQRGARSVIDVGGGASSLVDHLVDKGIPVAVLDIAEAGLALSSERVEPTQRTRRPRRRRRDDRRRHRSIRRVARPGRVPLPDRARRSGCLCRAWRRERSTTAGRRSLATFAPDGPERCSGLPVCRYDAAALARELGPAFRLEASEPYVHVTPSGVRQSFVYSRFTRL